MTQKLSSSVLHFPSKVFIAHKLPEKLSVSGSLAISAIKKHLSPNLKNENATVLDACPGDGTLSRGTSQRWSPKDSCVGQSKG